MRVSPQPGTVVSGGDDDGEITYAWESDESDNEPDYVELPDAVEA